MAGAINGSLHPLFRQLDAAEVEAVIEASYAREDQFLVYLQIPRLVSFSIGAVLAVVGAILIMVTVRRASKKETMFESRFYKLLCANAVIQATVMIVGVIKYIKWTGLLHSSYPYYKSLARSRSLVASGIPFTNRSTC